MNKGLLSRRFAMGCLLGVSASIVLIVAGTASVSAADYTAQERGRAARP